MSRRARGNVAASREPQRPGRPSSAAGSSFERRRADALKPRRPGTPSEDDSDDSDAAEAVARMSPIQFE
eukprot:scaffold1395_cov244-Pinguiococcus_pyrenoidosus.AAC.1